MKNKLFLLGILFFCVAYSSYAQKNVSGLVKGRLTDTAYRETLADATVSVLHSTDSSVISYTRANEKGEFQINNLDAGNYRLVVSYQGYQPVTRKFSITTAAPQHDMGVINMEKKNDMLEEIIVERPPITIKGDTVEFAASAFKTKPNAVAEDLLKKLPGVEVDKDGNITAQGETVPKIYVDGKEFFGNDPKMATKNITADMIESVQVFDDMSEQAKFTRIDDGTRTKTINIKIKKNMNKGYFGRATVGVATDDRYTANAMINRFKGDRRISLIGSSNNLNRQGFNSRDIIGGMGGFQGRGGRGGGGGNNGITRSTNGGINYTDNISSKIELTGAYMFGETKNQTSESGFRQTFFPDDSVSYQTQERWSKSVNRNHNFNLRLEYSIDSMNSLLFMPNLTLQQSSDMDIDTNFTKVSQPGFDEYMALSGSNRSNTYRDGLTLNNELLYRRRFNKRGRTFTLGFKNAINNSDGEGRTYAPLKFYNKFTGDIDSTRLQDFNSTQETRSNNNVVSTSYTEPLGINKILEFNYAYTNNKSTSDRKAVSYNENTKQYDSINAQQTNYFKNNFLAHRAGLNFRFKQNAFGFQVGGAMQTSILDNESIRAIYRVNGKDSVITTKQKYTNFFPTANLTYDFSRRKNLRVEYQGRTNQPNVTQLQDVRDETNVLRTVVGNPGLRQEFHNRVNLNYKTFNEENFRYLNMSLNFNQTSNKIVNSIALDTARGKGVQLIRPVNLNGAYSASYDINFGLPLKKKKGSSVNLSNTVRYNRDVSQLYEQLNYTTNLSISQSAGLNLDIKEKLNMEFRGRFSYNAVRYSAQQSQTRNLNTNYFNQNYSTDINYFILKNLIVSTDFNYSINTGRSDGFNQSVPLWNAGIAYQMFPKKNGEIKLTVNDILNQNKNIDRRIGENYIYDTRTVVLQRFFLLTFTYNLNRFGERGNNRGRGEFRMPGGGRGMGGGREWRGGGGMN